VHVVAGESFLLSICNLLVMVFKCITGIVIGIKMLQEVKFNMCILDVVDTCFPVAEQFLIYESVQVFKEYNIPFLLCLCHIRLI
jgi:hypothetical protein